jgi:hypothetical protein
MVRVILRTERISRTLPEIRSICVFTKITLLLSAGEQ